MPDYSAKYTDRTILNIRRKLRISYAQARKEMEKQLEDFLRRYQAKDEKKRAQVEAGQISEAQYQRWLIGQVFMKERRESKIRQLNETLEDTNNQALNIINEKRLDVFAENYNFEAFQAEKHTGISFDIYNTQAVAQLLKNHPQILPKWKIDEEKDYKWNYQKSQRSIMQGIVQGKSIPQITKDLCRVLATQNENRMALFARTGMTEAQNAGRIQQMHDAEDLGVEVKKQWLATLDSRTRDAHRQLDGQEKDVDEPFESDLGKIMYPGDPKAHPANVYNCRCTLISVYPKYRDIMQQNPERKAYGTYTDADGKEHRFNYLTRNPEGYAKWKREKVRNASPFIKMNEQGQMESDVYGFNIESSAGLDKIVKEISYGPLFPEAAVKITKETLEKLNAEYPLDFPLQIVGDTRIIRGLDLEKDRFDLGEELGFGAHYLQKGNAFIPDGKPGIEVLNEGYSTGSLLSEFRERHELRKRYGWANESTAFLTVSDTLEGTIIHEYAHAIQNQYGLFGGSSDTAAMKFSEWIYGYWEQHKEDARQMSNYAAQHPFEMMAEAFVQLHDIEHMDTAAYSIAKEIWDEFERFRKKEGVYAE